MQYHKISILTPSYNQGEHIEENIKSVLGQNYPNFEHIVVDAGSNDATVDILKRYSHLIWVSEPDKGQADALNKGLKMATGDIIGWINSDDFYMPNVFYEVNRAFSEMDASWVVSNQYSYRDGINKEVITKQITYKDLIKNPDIVKQQGAFYLKSIIEQVGAFDENLYMVMDYDLWLRLARVCVPQKIDIFSACFRHHDDQKTNNKNILMQYKEIKKVLKREKAPFMAEYMIGIQKYKSFAKKLIKQRLVAMNILDAKYLTQNIRQ
ncbi:MAG: glycosyltransferase [Chitinivibrionales bacterium]|nr:glycosyltransferase [Chitinivibrionales bacterium]